MSVRSFVPSGATKILIAIDKQVFLEPQGRWYSLYRRDFCAFSSFVEMIFQIDAFYSDAELLQQGMEYRSFAERESKIPKKRMEITKQMNDNVFEEKRGDKATFVIQVLFRQNSTWQGKVKWVETGEETKFRSTLELLKIMDNAMTEQVIHEQAK